jgi:hypothetical protein
VKARWPFALWAAMGRSGARSHGPQPFVIPSDGFSQSGNGIFAPSTLCHPDRSVRSAFPPLFCGGRTRSGGTCCSSLRPHAQPACCQYAWDGNRMAFSHPEHFVIPTGASALPSAASSVAADAERRDLLFRHVVHAQEARSHFARHGTPHDTPLVFAGIGVLRLRRARAARLHSG